MTGNRSWWAGRQCRDPPGEPADFSGSSPAAGSGPSPPVVDLNTATLEQLETLPGVGPVLGQHILDWRAAHGQFTSVDQLRKVSGIGDVRFAQLRGLVSDLSADAGDLPTSGWRPRPARLG